MHQRLLTPELMDDPGLEPGLLRAALAGLGRLNALSGADAITWQALRSEARAAGRSLRVLDVACAAGDLVLAARARAARERVPLEIHGCDINPHSIHLANERAAAQPGPGRFFVHDAIQPLPAGEYDIVMSSLFLHHLTNEHATLVLRRMSDAAARLVLVNDLVRSYVNLALIAVASHAVTRSHVVHTDAALSVRAAFTRPELLTLARGAGMENAELRWGGLCRSMLAWRRPA